MQIECTNCRKPLKLPDAKVPPGRAFSFTCPYCKTKNMAVMPADNGRPEAFAAAASPPRPLYPADAGPAYPKAGLMEDFDLDETADERPQALILHDDPESADILIRKLEEMGYQGHLAANMRDAARQIKLGNFRIILIQAEYQGATARSNQVLRAIQALDGKARRAALIALLSSTMTTLDDLTAFSLSVDAVINSADMEHIGQNLLSSIARAKKLYSAYNEILAEEGLA